MRARSTIEIGGPPRFRDATRNLGSTLQAQGDVFGGAAEDRPLDNPENPELENAEPRLSEASAGALLPHWVGSTSFAGVELACVSARRPNVPAGNCAPLLGPCRGRFRPTPAHGPTRAHSSIGQSPRLITGLFLVRTQVGPLPWFAFEASGRLAPSAFLRAVRALSRGAVYNRGVSC